MDNARGDSATLFIMSGLPAVGKSTLAKFIVRQYDAAYLRIDTIEQALRDYCAIDVEGEGYRITYRMAEDNLRLGRNVVADCCNPIELTRDEWQDVAKLCQCKFVKIEVICTDREEHRRRVEHRVPEIANIKLPQWSDVEKMYFAPWYKNRIIIDTAHKTIEECQAELKQKIDRYLAD